VGIDIGVGVDIIARVLILVLGAYTVCQLNYYRGMGDVLVLGIENVYCPAALTGNFIEDTLIANKRSYNIFNQCSVKIFDIL
jgi:hypothetical protein